MFNERGVTVDKDFAGMTESELRDELAGFDAWFAEHGEELIAGQPVLGPETIPAQSTPAKAQPVG